MSMETNNLSRRAILGGAATGLAAMTLMPGDLLGWEPAPPDDASRANAERINNCYKRIYISQHYEEWDPRFLENYDVNKLIKTIDEVDPDYMEITARTHNGLWFCDAGLGPLHKGLKGVDQLKAFIDHFHAKGKPVMAYMSTIWDKSLFDLHPDWRQVTREGMPVLGGGTRSFGNVVCPNSPYKDYLISMIQHVAKTHDVDGFYFDMTFFSRPFCYCASCLRLFREQYGAEPPVTARARANMADIGNLSISSPFEPAENWDDPLFRRFLKFKLRSNYVFVKDICGAVKQANPKLVTLIQYPILADTISGGTLEVGSVPDYLYRDVYIRAGYIMGSVWTKLATTIGKYRPEVGIMTRPGTHNDAPNMKSLDQLRSDAFTVLANGGAVQFFDIMWADGTLQQAMWDRMRQVFGEIKTREKWFGGKPIKSVAVFYSEKTWIWYGRENPEERYEANFFGICRALIEQQIPFNILTRLEDATLAGYQVLLLPNTVCMSEAEALAVAKFVNGGGGLVCTEKTSLWDEEGNALTEYRLAEVLGVHHAGDTGTYSRVYSCFDTEKAPAKRLPADGLMTSWGAAQKVEVKGAEVLARLVYPYAEPTGARFVNVMANPPAVKTEWPACTVNRYGKGKAIYFVGGIDRDYLKLSFPELKWLMGDAVRMVAREPLPVQVKAPLCVEVNAFEREKQLVVHLVNFQPEMSKYMAMGPIESRHSVQEILPVYELEVAVRGLKGLKTVEQQPEGKVLSHREEAGVVIVKVPRLDCHSMIVFNL
jgi:Hypothetical glycosyl hydrolase 6/Beta-galactosidase trimerisation domain